MLRFNDLASEQEGGCAGFVSDQPMEIAQKRRRFRKSVGIALPKAPERCAWRIGRIEVSGLTKVEVEELLDWLEARGCTEPEVVLTADDRFMVRYAFP